MLSRLWTLDFGLSYDYGLWPLDFINRVEARMCSPLHIRASNSGHQSCDRQPSLKLLGNVGRRSF
jgi:hypothetical protein